MLDSRLKKCMDLVSGRGVAVDVGTDHAHLAAELVKTGKCKKVIASDVNEGPLRSAAATVEKCGISQNVELILSDGLENIPLGDVTDVVVAGMGGETIAEIIGAKKDELSGVNLILQPMTKPEVLRKSLAECGITVEEEFAVEHGGKMYVVMLAKVTGEPFKLTEYESLRGGFDENNAISRKYLAKEAERLERVSASMRAANMENPAIHSHALSERLKNGSVSMNIDEIFKFVDKKFPFSDQESWDNSGFLVERTEQECKKVLLTLDITHSVLDEAEKKGIDLVISHHPVIFHPLKKIGRNDVVFRLIESGIAAVCMHTNLDISPNGTNYAIVKRLSEGLELAGDPQPFEELGAEKSLGFIVEPKEPVAVEEFEACLRKIFGEGHIRRNSNIKNRLSKIAICSGSGGSLLGLAMAKGCDCMVTGDVKHDVWIDANNASFALFDCGHFHTENIVLEEVRAAFEREFPLLDVEIAESSTNPCVYI